MAKNKKTIRNIIIVLVLLLGLILIFQPSFFIDLFRGQTPSPSFSAPKGGSLLQVRLYDSNGNVVGTIGSQSIFPLFSTVTKVSGGGSTSGVTSLDFVVSIDNSGSEPLSCKIATVNAPIGSAFGTIPTALKNAPVGGSTGWISTGVAITSFEQPAPAFTRFEITADCTYDIGGGPISAGGPKTANVDLYIEADAQGSFSVTLDTGTLPTEFCGDGVCQGPGEDALNCPGDCSAPSANVKFRTNSLTYVSGTDIAYKTTAQCGATPNLVGYGRGSSAQCYSGTDATCPTISGYTLEFSGIKGAPTGSTINGGCLYKHNTDTTLKRIYWKTISSISPCTIVGQWKYYSFDSDDFDAGEVSLSPLSELPDNEVAC